MIKQKRAEASSITLIVAAVIGLIILAVIIAMLSGKLGGFGKGADDATTCDSLCRAAGFDGHDEGKSGEATLGIKDGEDNQCYCINQ